MKRHPASHPRALPRIALIAGASLLVAGALFLLLRPRTPSRPHVLLITIDTLRGDRLGLNGYRLDTSPFLDEFGTRGANFTDCTVQWPKTWPSIASLMTGSYPKTTGMKADRRVMSRSLYTMAEIFAKSGYATAAVVGNFNLGDIFGFDQGFDHFVHSWEEGWQKEAGEVTFENSPGRVKQYTNATIITDYGLDWLEERNKSEPFFLWLHYMDPHGPYVPPKEYRDRFRADHPVEPVNTRALPPYQVQQVEGSRISLRNGRGFASDLGFYKAQYDAEIRYLDDQLRRLIDAMNRRDLMKNTLVVLAADHGESLGEHRYLLEHGRFSYQVNARVPLMLVHPTLVGNPGNVTPPVGLIDVPPTILDLVGIPAPVTFEGQSLVDLMQGDASQAPEYVFMESGRFSGAYQRTIRAGPWKLIHVPSADDRRLMTGEAYELYDLTKDPGELRNLAGEHPERVERLSTVLAEWFASGPRYAAEGKDIDLESLDAKSKEMLRSLGYMN